MLSVCVFMFYIDRCRYLIVQLIDASACNNGAEGHVTGF